MNFPWICFPAKCAAVVLYFVVSSSSNIVLAFGTEKLGFGTFSWPGTPLHELITRNAITHMPPFYLSSGQAVTFSDRAITEIADYNARTDSDHPLADEVHFDSESFDDGQKRLRGLRDSIRLGVFLLPDGGAIPRRNLGHALHTVQDFYSHSTWVEKGHTGTVPLWESGFVIPHAKRLDNTCYSSGPIPGAALTSDYWNISNLWSGSTDYYLLVGAAKCGHGKGDLCNDPAKCPGNFDKDGNLVVPAAGINKDTPVRAHFSEALRLAIESSTEFIQVILSDLGPAGDLEADRRRCKLMGESCEALHLMTKGAGKGKIAVSDAPGTEILKDCAVDCLLGVKAGTLLTVEAKPEPGSDFLYWEDYCATLGSSSRLSFVFSAGTGATLCTARFGTLRGVRFHPSGDKVLAAAPFYLQLVNVADLSPTTVADLDVTVTFLREVFSACRGKLFSSPRTVAIAKGQSLSGDLAGFAAGVDPFCRERPIKTVLTITDAVVGATERIDITKIPADQRQLSITR